MIKEITREEYIKKFGWAPKETEVYLNNGITLFREDWNGEVYLTGFDTESNCCTGKDYRPLYERYLDKNDCFEDYKIVGYEEV